MKQLVKTQPNLHLRFGSILDNDHLNYITKDEENLKSFLHNFDFHHIYINQHIEWNDVLNVDEDISCIFYYQYLMNIYGLHHRDIETFDEYLQSDFFFKTWSDLLCLHHIYETYDLSNYKYIIIHNASEVIPLRERYEKQGFIWIDRPNDWSYREGKGEKLHTYIVHPELILDLEHPRLSGYSIIIKGADFANLMSKLARCINRTYSEKNGVLLRELRTLKSHEKHLIQFFPTEIYMSLIAEYVFFKWIPMIGHDAGKTVNNVYVLKYASPRKRLDGGGNLLDDPLIIDLIDNKRVHR